MTYKGFNNKTYYAEFLTFGHKHHPWDGVTTSPQSVLPIEEYRKVARWFVQNDELQIKPLRADGRGGKYYHSNHTIRLSCDAPFWLFIHELAHYMNHRIRDGKGHDRYFRGYYLRLVYLQFGEIYADKLADTFTSIGLKVSMPILVSTGISTEVLVPALSELSYKHDNNARISYQPGSDVGKPPPEVEVNVGE